MTSSPRLGRGTGLRACPFCRELFTDGESTQCPDCGIKLADLSALPPSLEAEALIHEEAASATHAANAPLATIADTTPLPLADMSRRRGVLLVCSAIGFLLFFLPWTNQTLPDVAHYSGLDLARAKGFFWSTFAAWLVLVPSVLSRRTVLKMIGSRAACVVLAAIPALQCGFLLTRPNRQLIRGIPYEFSWGAAIYLTIALSLVATIAAFGFGGKLESMEGARRL